MHVDNKTSNGSSWAWQTLPQNNLNHIIDPKKAPDLDKKRTLHVNDDAGVPQEETANSNNATENVDWDAVRSDNQAYQEARKIAEPGDAQLARHHYKSAITYYNAALRVYPDHPQVLYYRAFAKSHLNDRPRPGSGGD